MEQPTKPIPQDIKTLQDYLFTQFAATDPMEVQNILPTSYYFKYCTNEDIETPDPLTRRVIRREYEEITLQPGETKVLMGAAAYIFVSGVARQHVLETQGADATAQLQALIDAADSIIIGKVGYAGTVAQKAAPAPVHNPNAIKDDAGVVPSQTDQPVLQPTNKDEDAFAAPSVAQDGSFEVDGNTFDTVTTGNGALRYRMNKVFTSAEKYNAALEAHNAARQA